MSIPVAVHAGVDEIPWVPNPTFPGAQLRLLQADVDAGLYVMAGRMPAGLHVGRHHHSGAVHMFTLSGAWGYREHDFVNRAGSYLYEPPDSVHTLFTPEDNTELTETLTVVYGITSYLNESDEVVAVSDARSNLAAYYAACEAAGLARPTAIIT